MKAINTDKKFVSGGNNVSNEISNKLNKQLLRALRNEHRKHFLKYNFIVNQSKSKEFLKCLLTLRSKLRNCGMAVQRDFVRVEGIDLEIQIVFQAKHLKLLTPLFEIAGVKSEIVDKMIDDYISAGEPVAFERWVLEYGQSKLNPMMNAFLKRQNSHPTFNNLLKLALKDEIENSPILRKLKKMP